MTKTYDYWAEREAEEDEEFEDEEYGWDDSTYQKVHDELDDYDTAPYWKPRVRADTGYLDGMWSRYGRDYDKPSDAVIAHGMVQSFVNAFARDGFYQVMFSDSTVTAETDMVRRKVRITPAPLLDKRLTVERKGRILTALSVHEISHPRYGRQTWKAVNAAFPSSTVAQLVSGALDDNRIETSFVDEYPGYAGVFKPAEEYVAEGMRERNPAPKFQEMLDNPVGSMIAAVRYRDHYDWTGHEAELEFWTDWNERWHVESSPRRHVEAVREGLVHIVAVARARRKLPPGPGSGPGPTPGPGRGKIGTAKGKTGGSKTGSSAGSGDPTEATDEDATRQTDAPGAGSRDDALKALEKAIQRAVRSAEKMEDSGLSSEADQAASDMPYEIHVCIDSDAVEAAATGASVSSHDIHLARVEIQNQIDSAIEFEDGDLGRVHVMRSIRTLGNKRGYNRMADRVKTNETASRFIRDALLRSRTGRESVGRYQRHGRLDQRALHRVLGDDPQRVFEKKHRESPGRYLVWLMLDHSASMAGGPDRSTAEVATAFVNALQHVPTMRAEVWAWSDAFKAGIWGPGVVRAWKTGQPVSDIAKIVDLKYGGTPDSQILAWAYRSILKSVRTGETPVILFASDGQGHVSGMRQNVEKARALGVLVRSVAIGAINEEDQATIYGRHGYVPWAGTMTKTARAMAGMVARIVSGAER